MAIPKPKVAFFELSSCEGCQLQLVNNEATLLDFLSLVDVRTFRESMTEKFDDYDIAFVEGSVHPRRTRSNGSRNPRKAKVLVALWLLRLLRRREPAQKTASRTPPG